MSIKLITAKIKNFKSLGDIELNFRDLTIIVGANSSGKSNCLEALRFLGLILFNPTLPPADIMPRYLRSSKDKIGFNIALEDDKNNAEYSLFIGLKAKKTVVIFTTHSSQLLDCFETEEISSEISVILLSKKPDWGTKSFFLDKLAESREDLLDWMTDFGVGSAIYHSQLLQEI